MSNDATEKTAVAHAAMDEMMDVTIRVSAEVSDALEGKSPMEIGTIIHEKIESIFGGEPDESEEPDLLNAVTADLLKGFGASEDHETFKAALKKGGFTDEIIERITWAVCTTEPRDVHIAALKTLQGMRYEYRGGELWAPPIDKAPAFAAPDLLDAAAGHMRDRAKTYDKPGGERSMGKTVEMFNIATGRDLRESEGWLLLELLKIVRGETRAEPHRDSLEDEIAYAALKAEARLGGR